MFKWLTQKYSPDEYPRPIKSIKGFDLMLKSLVEDEDNWEVTQIFTDESVVRHTSLEQRLQLVDKKRCLTYVVKKYKTITPHNGSPLRSRTQVWYFVHSKDFPEVSFTQRESNCIGEIAEKLYEKELAYQLYLVNQKNMQEKQKQEEQFYNKYKE